MSSCAEARSRSSSSWALRISICAAWSCSAAKARFTSWWFWAAASATEACPATACQSACASAFSSVGSVKAMATTPMARPV
ncbi:MAG: hypothetical protein A6D92_13215 [Symbiobacterium thermophilum]|uniref:Uncharacterized protein n=1 Tax=Symbiobacterium thermophilum TaxID=2734 RepID=A0A1Y2T2U4_SYMTR|nr:MAG: hypothetical protein A6D92_13215 [Symbiobacterium thermophilum]